MVNEWLLEEKIRYGQACKKCKYHSVMVEIQQQLQENQLLDAV